MMANFCALSNFLLCLPLLRLLRCCSRATAVLDSRSEARAPQCQHYEGAPESNEIGPGRGRRGWHRPCHHRLERSRSGRGQKIDDTRQAAWILASSETRGRVRLVSFIGQRNSFSYRFLARSPKATGFSKLKERLLIVA